MAEKPTFEQAMTRLEAVVRALEKGDAPLDQALGLFEEGTRLVRFCGESLDRAEQKIVLLTRGQSGEMVQTTFLETE